MGVVTGPAKVTVLASSASAVSVPADLTEDTLVTITVPAGVLGLNGALRIKTFWTLTSSANNKTVRIRYSGAGGTAVAPYVYTTVSAADVQAHVQNRASASSQVAAAMSLTNSGNAITGPQALAVDTTVATTIVITGQKALAGETITLESYLVEIINP